MNMTLADQATTSGSGEKPGNSDDADRSEAGAGGSDGTPGRPGLVILTWP